MRLVLPTALYEYILLGLFDVEGICEEEIKELVADHDKLMKLTREIWFAADAEVDEIEEHEAA